MASLTLLFLFYLIGYFGKTAGDCSVTTPGVYTYGDNCEYTCHCKDGARCDQDTGACSNGCDAYWFGPACQYRDIAEGQFSRISSNINPPQYSYKAHDGDISTCSHTDSKPNSWWRIWFPQNVTFNNIYLLTLKEKLDNFRDFKITVEYVPEDQHISNIYQPTDIQTCYQHGSSPPGNEHINKQCSQPLVGNQMRILLSDSVHQLVLCDVRINLECPVNQCGYDCSVVCHCKSYGSINDITIGNCSLGCEERWTGSNKKCDTECPVDKWGEQCQRQCGACRTGTCDVVSGNCNGGCQDGYDNTDKCKNECPDGSYGRNCANTCSEHCKGSKCDKVNGECTDGCKPGYMGSKCDQVCPDYTYGDRCNQTCSSHCVDVCNNVDGKCTNCKEGWMGDFCSLECPDGRYGGNCANQCSLQCKESPCNKMNGECIDGCKPGYTGSKCDQVCPTGTYGDGCSQNCSIHCNDVCNNVDGKCMECKAGLNGSRCDQECKDGSYGIRCVQTCAPRCAIPCDKTNGHCSQCEPGWKGTICDSECLPGYYGVNCEQRCSMFCKNTCNRENGECGCVDGWRGSTCTIVEVSQSSNGGIIASYVVAGLMTVWTVCLTVVVVCMLMFKRARTTNQGKSDMTAKDTPSQMYEDLHRNDMTSGGDCNYYQSMMVEETVQ